MLHLLYILAFTTLALIAVSNLIRNLMMFSMERDRSYPAVRSPMTSPGSYPRFSSSAQAASHPELLDTTGNLTKDPLLVVRFEEDVRAQLDALYNASPESKNEQGE
ncbi:MAG: DUF2973 domain-containing protein [Chroococcidiopsidaceae cyanobacterium CP_BM_ER_R8_30]|nr:DUF2973 domain-containing protein [Chroococcidiopsidaceae cyanobacterium CP_BM_ER_R8_30]